MPKYNDDLFEDVKYDDKLFDDQKYDETLFEDTPVQQPEVSMGESLARGAVQGATLGFGEEAGSAIATPFVKAYKAVSERIPGSPENVDKQLLEQGFTGDIEAPQSLGETYRGLRDTTREANKAAQEANPYTYLAGEIAGGVAPAIASGGASAVGGAARVGLKEAVKAGAKAGAKFGAVAGLGGSEADLTQGEVGEAAKDVAIGAGAGAALGTVLPLAGAGLKASERIRKSMVKSLRNDLPILDSIIEVSQRTTRGEKDFLGQNALNKQIKNVTESVAELAEAGERVSEKLGSQIGVTIKKATKGQDISKDIQKLSRELRKNAADAGTEDTEKQLIRQANRLDEALNIKENIISTPEDIALQKAIMKRNVKIADRQIKENTTLEPITKEFSDPVIDAANNRVTFFDYKTGDIISTPITGKKIVEKIVEKKIFSPPELKKIASRIGDELKDLTPKARREASKVFGFFKDKIRSTLSDDLAVKEYDSLNKKFSLLKNSFNVLNKNLDNMDAATAENAKLVLANLADELGDVRNINSQRIFNNFFEKIDKIDPQMFKEAKNKILENAKVLDLNMQYLGQDPTQSGNVGRLFGAIGQLSMRGARVYGATAREAGKISNTVSEVAHSLSKNVSSMTKEGLQALSAKTSIKSPRISNFLKSVAEVESDSKRQALTFSAMQNPEFRKEMEEILGKEKE